MMVRHQTLASRNVVIDPTSAADDVSTYAQKIDVWRVENGVDYAQVALADKDFRLYDSIITQGDDIAIYLGYAEDGDLAASDLAFYGFVEDSIPHMDNSGQVTTINLRSYGRCILDLVCGEEYGSESTNSGLDTIAEILQDNTDGVLDEWVNSNNLGSGYTLDTSLVEAITGAIRYIYSPYDPVKSVIDAAVNVVQAIKGDAAGPHYILKTEESAGPSYTHYFLLTTVGSHSSGPPDVAAKWPTWWDTDATNSTLEVAKDQIIQHFVKQRQEANYILYQGAFRKPLDGDVYTNNNAASWGSSGGPGLSVVNESTVVKVGSHSIEANSVAYAGSHHIYYPSTQDWSYDFTKISGKHTPATLNFYIHYTATGGSPTSVKVSMRTSNTPGSNRYSAELYTDYLARAGQWYFVSLPLGDFDSNPKIEEHFPSFTGWVASGGTENWNDIDCVEFSFDSLATATNVYWDGLFLAGYVRRGAKKSGETYYKHKVFTDNFAKDDILKSGTPGTTDIGTLAYLAKAELYRAARTPITGSIRIPGKPSILAGQKTHIHACKKSDGTFSIDSDMRVTSHHLMYAPDPIGFVSDLTLTDDLKNGIPQPSVMDEYNMMLRYVNPDSQNRQISSIKMRKVEISGGISAIFEESYTF